MDACKTALQCRRNPIIPTDSVMQMIEVVLNNNNFCIAGKYYQQMDGIAIGSRLGKNFACSYMRVWDEALLNYTVSPLFYKRFIDDGFGIWTGDLDGLKALRAMRI